MNKNIFIFILPFLFNNLFAQNEFFSPFKIDLEKEINHVQSVNLTEIGNMINYIPLQAPADTLLRDILRITITNSHIAVYYRHAKTVLYDSFGKFVVKLEFPNHYTTIGNIHFFDHCFSLDEKKLYFLSLYDIIKYDIELNDLKYYTKPHRYIHEMLPIDDDLFVFYSNNSPHPFIADPNNVSHSLIISDLQNNIRKTFKNDHQITSIEAFPLSFKSTPFYYYDGNVRFKQYGDHADTLFALTEAKYSDRDVIMPQRELLPYAVLNLGEKAMPINIETPLRQTWFSYKLGIDSINKIMGISGKYFVKAIYEDMDNLHIRLSDYSSKNLYGYFNKNKKTTKIIGKQGYQNNIDGGLPFFPKYAYKDILVDYMPVSVLRKHILNSDATEMNRLYGKSYDDLVELINNLDDEINHIVVLVKK